jgi:benzoate transport
MEHQLLDSINTRPMQSYQWFVIIICMGLNIIDGFDVMVMAFTAASVAKAWLLTGAQLGILLSAGLFGMAAGSIALAPLADRIGRRKLLLLCLAIAGLSMLASAFTHSQAALALCRFVTGIGVGGILASSNVMASEYANARWRSLAVSLMSTGYGIGATLGGVLSLLLISHVGWRAVFMAGGLSSLAMLWLSWRLLPESLDYLLLKQPDQALQQINQIGGKIGLEPLSSLAQYPHQAQAAKASQLFQGGLFWQTLCLWLAFFLVMFGFYFIMSWTPKILIAMGMSAEQGVSTGILISIGGIFGAALIGLIAAKMRIFYALSVFLAGTVGCIYAFVAVSAEIAWALGIGLLLGTLINGCVAGLYAIAPRIYPAGIRSRGVGYAIGFGRCGAILSPTVAGICLDRQLEVTTLYGYYSLSFLVAIVLVLLLGYAYQMQQQHFAQQPSA